MLFALNMQDVHPLRRWLLEHRIKAVEFADRIGVSGSAVSQWLNGQRVPSLRQAVEISDATSGAVQPRDLLPPPQPSPE